METQRWQGSCFQRDLQIGRGNASYIWSLTTLDRGCWTQAHSRRGRAIRAGCTPEWGSTLLVYSCSVLCVQDIPQTGVNETAWKAGRATWPQLHSPPMLTDVSCLPHEAQPLLRPLGFLVNASVVARSCFKVCFRPSIIKTRVMKNLLEEALNTLNWFCLYFPYFSHSIFIMDKQIFTKLTFY